MPRSLLALALLTSSVFADNWPAWRGPTGQGRCDEKNVPLKWGEKENVVWKVPLTDHGNSTPVVWGDKIFLTQATKKGGVRSLMCFARTDGERLWKVDVEYKAAERNWDEAWYANASPTTDGERVLASFGSAGVYCYDLSGKELWKRTDLGKWDHQFGSGASPVLYGNLLIQWCGPNEREGKNVLLAMDKKTGKTVWEHEEGEGSWATPVIAAVGGKDQLVLGAGKSLKGYDPAKGKELWRCDGLDGNVFASAVVADGLAVGMSGYGPTVAAKLGGSGDISKDRYWRHEKPANQRVGSGVVVGDHLYLIDEDGSPRCFELKTGKNLWADEPKLKGAPTWGSLVHADGRLYILMRDGTTHVLAAKPKYDILATNKLSPGEQTNSSVVISDGQIFLRTSKHLWCVVEKK